MAVARRLIPTHDTVFGLCVSVAIAILCLALAASCSASLPDRSTPRSQRTRIVSAGGARCAAWLPLTVRTDLGQDYLAATLAAAQPWADGRGYAAVVPAREGEDATLTVTVDACPLEYTRVAPPHCQRIAQTRQTCDGGVYRQRIELFTVGDGASIYYVLVHELGHALGVQRGADRFGHADDPGDIMFPSIFEPVGSDDQVSSAPAQRVTDADIASVRLVWGIDR